MQRWVCGLAGCALMFYGAGAADAQDTVKIGLIMPYSGQFADTAAHGDTVGGAKVEFVRKDTGGIAPDIAKRLAQQAIVRDHADILGGFVLTPNALAAAEFPPKPRNSWW